MKLQEEIVRRVRGALPDAQIELRDLTGGGDHWQAVIVSQAFDGQTPIARQRLVFGALGELMHGPIHALTLKTLTPQQAESNGR
ncbi:MAG: BolA family protein [Bradymonadia bacterium]|jgi:stress-induced morphogen